MRYVSRFAGVGLGQIADPFGDRQDECLRFAAQACGDYRGDVFTCVSRLAEICRQIKGTSAVATAITPTLPVAVSFARPVFRIPSIRGMGQIYSASSSPSVFDMSNGGGFLNTGMAAKCPSEFPNEVWNDNRKRWECCDQSKTVCIARDSDVTQSRIPNYGLRRRTVGPVRNPGFVNQMRFRGATVLAGLGCG